MQRIIQGIDKLPHILKEINCKKLFLVVDVSFSCLNIKEQINSLQVDKVFFSDFTSNPLYEQVCKGINLLKVEKCDCILAVGGGSAIDVAKCIKLAVLAKDSNDYISLLLGPVRVDINSRDIPFIAITTTAGTGSESTHNAVVYYEGIKQTVTNDSILPDYAILEPSVLETLPVYQKKCTMMDALCQGIESYWSVNSTKESYEYSRKAIEFIMKNWEAYIFDNDLTAAEKIMRGANYSGRAINITQTTAAHAMSYKITSLYHFPHGHAVAVCLPGIWEYMIGNIEKCIDSRGQEYLADIFEQIVMAMGCTTSIEAITLFREMMVKMELQNPIPGNREKELEILSKTINPVRLKNNPVEINQKTAFFLYKHILK